MVCIFTGHRPERLPWGQAEDDARCAALRGLIVRSVLRACAEGCDTFLCGMARGCDTYFAEAVLAAKTRFPNVRLIASGCMLRRNRAMVDAAELVITVYDGEPGGGTAATVRYAERRGKRLLRLWC